MIASEIDAAWGDMAKRLDARNIPPAELNAFNAAYNAWGDRYATGTPIPAAELPTWEKRMRDFQPVVNVLLARYTGPAVLAPSQGSKTGSDVSVTGALPWWYWPLRIGAGAGAAYLMYRVLRPEVPARAAFAGMEDSKVLKRWASTDRRNVLPVHAMTLDEERDGTYTVRFFTRGKATGASHGHKTRQAAEDRARQEIEGAAQYDNIHYKSTKASPHGFGGVDLPKAYSQYGASMGRRSALTEDGERVEVRRAPARISLRKIKLDSGGYDSGGAYWGSGASLYRATDADGDVELFFRAPSRSAAKAIVQNRVPNATFYR